MFARSSNGLLIHLLTSLCMILILACNQEVGVGSSIENRLQIEVEPAFPNLKFKNLTNLVQPDDQYDLMFVTEQSGLIHAFRNSDGIDTSSTFLDIRNRVSTQHNEEGLLGIAFDPLYADNGEFYLYYSASLPRRSIVSRFNADTDNHMQANPTSEVIILEIPQPFGNHNGGQLAFGPDGYLYIGVGDGGSGGDPLAHGQNLGTMLGAVLRIGVDGTNHEKPYLIPKDNPFLDIDHAQGEIWAHGLRNPWRFSFDGKTGQLWLGDVGQNRSEEINLIDKGGNYGWAEMEGSTCYPNQNECIKADFHAPVAEYGRSEGCTIIGGFVYRGVHIADLNGYYVYGDYCSGKIWAIKYEDGHAGNKHLLYETNLSVTSFGQDRQKDLYVLSRNSGIYRLTDKD